MKPNVIFGLTSCTLPSPVRPQEMYLWLHCRLLLAKAKLLIVIDGNPNNPTTPIDDTAEGKKKLWRYGYEILHLTRDDIMHHFEDVCLEIEERIEEATGVLS